MRRGQTNAIIALVWLAFAAAVALDLKAFTIWEQVLDIHAQGWTIWNLYEARHAHFLRYLVAYPIFLVADELGASKEVVFNLVCLALVPALVAVLRRIETVGTPEREAELRTAIYAVILFVVAYFMNGRVLFGLLGYSLLNLAFVRYFWLLRWTWCSLAQVLVGLLLCSVSSGVFAVAFLFMGLCMVLDAFGPFKAERKVRFRMIISVALAFLMFQEFLILGIVKNLDFYGGGPTAVWDMLDHGLGRYLFAVDPPLLLLAVPMLLMLGYIGVHVIVQSTAFNAVVLLAIVSALSGGIYGLSTLSICLVPILLFRPVAVLRTLAKTVRPYNVDA